MTEVKKQPIDELVHDEEGFRMSTPVIIAKYKAERLKSATIADLGCGIGVQALNFALVSDRVVAIDNDEKRLEALRENAKIMKLNNLELIRGDVLSREVIERVGAIETVHSDPSRKRVGERWSFDDLSPNPLKIIESYRCDKLSFDLPAFFPKELIPTDWELEYISLSGELKRLSVYVGESKKFRKSAVVLPEGERVVENLDLVRETRKLDEPLKWIYDLDGSLYYSGLVPEFLHRYPDLSLLQEDRQRILLTGDKLYVNPFLLKSYSVIDSAVSISDVKRKLIKLKAGKVLIRFSMDPSKYYEERGKLEKDLDGEETIYIFRFRGAFFMAKRAEKAEADAP